MAGSRAQSAMEYLMTYGWAILIIAVVLGALFALGVFNSGAFLGTACVAQSGYLCQSPILDTNGSLAFTFGQATGYTEYDILLACTASTNSIVGGPLNQSAWNDNSSTNYPWDFNTLIETCGSGGNKVCPYLNYTIGNQTVPSGATQTVYNLQCFNDQGIPANQLSVGQSYTGQLWIEYWTDYNATAAQNYNHSVAPQVTEVGTLAVKVS